jgi:hypothetical protein
MIFFDIDGTDETCQRWRSLRPLTFSSGLTDPVVEKKRYAALVFAQSGQTSGMLCPMAPPICASGLRNLPQSRELIRA